MAIRVRARHLSSSRRFRRPTEGIGVEDERVVKTKRRVPRVRDDRRVGVVRLRRVLSASRD